MANSPEEASDKIKLRQVLAKSCPKTAEDPNRFGSEVVKFDFALPRRRF